MKLTSLNVVLAFALLLGAAPALAHDEAGSATDGYFDALLTDVDRVAENLTRLAEAIPAEKYTWRPAEGVRSVSETMLHVAAANFGLSHGLGKAFPEGVPDPRTLETEMTDKAEVTAMLERSIAHARAAIEEARGTDLAREVDLFGNKMTSGRVLTLLSGHMHEHLGQLIAYARMNDVVPPWSAPPAGAGGADDDSDSMSDSDGDSMSDSDGDSMSDSDGDSMSDSDGDPDPDPYGGP